MRKFLLGILVCLIAIGSGAVIASANIPNSSTQEITACLNGEHAARVIDEQASSACATGESTLRWSAGLTAVQVIQSDSAYNSISKEQVATCPGSKNAIAGWYTLTAPGSASITANYAVSAQSWRVDATDLIVGNWAITVFALCGETP